MKGKSINLEEESSPLNQQRGIKVPSPNLQNFNKSFLSFNQDVQNLPHYNTLCFSQ